MAKSKKNKNIKGTQGNDSVDVESAVLETQEGVAEKKPTPAGKKNVSIEEKMASMDEATFWGSFIKDNRAGEDVGYSKEEQNEYLGNRNVNPFFNSILLYDRFDYKKGVKPREEKCTLLLRKDTGKKVGLLARYPLSYVWRTAQVLTKNRAEETFNLSGKEWLTHSTAISEYIESTENFQKSKKEKRPVLVQDLFKITELEYEELFLEKGKEAIDIIKAAVEQDIAESERLAKKWRKIWRYPYKVSLLKEEGGIFSKKDAEILKQNGIHYLNDIRKFNIYQLKNMLLDHYLKDLIEELNAAFKEDLARKRDTRYKIYPFIHGGAAMLASAVVGYYYQYTLLKNQPMTTLIFILLGMWAVVVGTVVWAGLRARLRQKKRPGYVFYTRPVRQTILMLSVFSLFSIGSISFFYERYDGYDDLVYYRNLGNDQVAIAGLVDKEAKIVAIPEMIDGKTVVEIDRGAFFHDEMEIVIVPETVEQMDAHVFVNCRSLQDVQLSSNISRINKKTFLNCEQLESIRLPEGMTVIEEKAFVNCNQLKRIQLPTTIESIGEKAFLECWSLNQIDNLSRVKTIGAKAFQACGSLEKLDLSSAVTIGEAAFQDCTWVNSVALGANVDVIRDSAFNGCSSLAVVAGLEGVANIGNEAFKDCHELRNVTFGNGLNSIGKSAFENCSAMTEVIIPNSIQTMGKNAFKGCSEVSFLQLPFIGKTREQSHKSTLGYTITCDSGVYKTVEITDMPVIHSKAFKDCTVVKEVNFNDVVTQINKGAFKGAHNLEAVILSDSMDTISADTFKDCGNLRSITGGANVKYIEESAFENCGSISTIRFPLLERIGPNAFGFCSTLSDLGEIDKWQYIGASAFESCSSLKSIALPYGVTAISESAFENSGLQYVEMANVSQIFESAFMGCSELIEIWGLDNVGLIEKQAFSGCGQLGAVRLGDSLTEIGKKAFEDCYSLTEVIVPTSVQKMGRRVFEDCNSLKGLSMPFIGKTREKSKWYSLNYTIASRKEEGRLTVEVTDMPEIHTGAFRSCSIVEHIVFGEGVTEIAKSAFANATGLKSIVLPSTIQTIKQNTFKNCESLVDIYGGNSVTAIEKNAFKNCYSLGYINFQSLQHIGDGVFMGCSTLSDLGDIDNLQYIGEGAFESCSSLKKISLPAGITAISADAFKDSGLQYVEMENVSQIFESAFMGCSELIEIWGLDNVGLIEKQAFSGCGQLGAIRLGGNLTEIGKKAFEDCYSLTEVIVPTSVQKMGRRVFEDCNSLKGLSMPFIGKTREKSKWYSLNYTIASRKEEGRLTVEVTDMPEIHTGAFRSCSIVEHIVFGEGVTEIAKAAFANATGLKSIVLPSTLQTIKQNTFKNCDNLMQIYGGNGVTAIEKKAFKNCYSLENVNFKSLQRIENGAFAGCRMLNDLGDIDDLQYIGEGAFESCSNLQTITLPAGITSISPDTFKDSGLQYVEMANVGNISSRAFKDCSELIEIQGLENVTLIEKQAFSGCERLSAIRLSNNLTEIGKKAFEDCDSLKEATIPTSVQKMGRRVFEDCNSLESLSMPFIGKTRDKSKWYSLNYTIASRKEEGRLTVELTDMSVIHSGAFKSCSIVDHIVFGEGVTEIAKSAFADASGLQSIVLPSTIQTIKKNTFKDCHHLTSVIGSEHITQIEKGAFKNCRALETINFDNVQRIEEGAFKGCYQLKNIGSINDLQYIGKQAFYGCSSLSNITFPVTLTEIEKEAFMESGLQDVNFSGGLQRIGDSAFRACGYLKFVDLFEERNVSVGQSVFKECYALETLILPDSMLDIPKKLAEDCTSLQHVQMGQNTKTIGEKAFANTALREVSIPNSTEEIKSKAFYDCGKMTSLTISSSVQKIGRKAFANAESLDVVKTPFLGKKRGSAFNGFGYLFGSGKQLTYLEVTDLDVVKTGTFNGAKNVQKIVLGEGIEEIKSKAFKGFNLQQISLPSTLNTIGKKAFAKCEHLTEMNLRSTAVSELGKAVFKGCDSMVALTLPETVETVPVRMAEGCSALKNMYLPSSIKEVKKNAFKDCTALESLAMTDSVEKIGTGVAYGCSSLSNLILSNNLAEIPQNAFRECSNLQAVTIPDSVTRIRKNAFRDCNSLSSATFGSGLKKIDSKAFYNCSLDVLKLQEGIEKIGSEAFASNGNLSTVVLPKSLKKLGIHAFEECMIESLTVPFVGWNRSFAFNISYITDSYQLRSLTITDAKKLANHFLRSADRIDELAITCPLEKVRKNTFAEGSNLSMVVLHRSLSQYETMFPNASVVYMD
ncbi:MAG: leucine-rich repeat domain-containing protein [Clostridiales bacterium]|nr:leucine-rich repeat domain-containing protein [Clostridiales bacterium]